MPLAFECGTSAPKKPWPDVSEEQKAATMQKAQAVLDARSQFPDSSLADLYDPNTMPPVLTKTHAALDSAVDKLYRKTAFPDDAARVAFLFELYGKKTEGLTSRAKKQGRVYKEFRLYCV